MPTSTQHSSSDGIHPSHHPITVVIPTFRRGPEIIETLRSLQGQTIERFEILLMDNAGEPALEERVQEFNLNARVPVTYVVHTEGGNSGARNRGAALATGEILIFTDDDLTFDPDWLTAYDEAFRMHAEMLASGGCVRPNWEAPPPEWFLRYMGSTACFPVLALMDLGPALTLSSEGFFFSCNMALRAEAFSISGFHPEMIRRRTIGDGESGFEGDLRRQGHLIGYVPGAIAYHRIPRSRMTVKAIRNWAWHAGGADMFAHWRRRKRSWWRILGAAPPILLRLSAHGSLSLLAFWSRHPRVIRHKFKTSYGACKLTYLWWMLTDPEVRAALSCPDFRPEEPQN